MPQRKNSKRRDWLWVELKRLERAKQGKQTEFHFHGRICSDAKISKNIARNVNLTDVLFTCEMPGTPEGWAVMTPPDIDTNPVHWTGSDTEEPDFSELIGTTAERFGVSGLTAEKDILYGFLRMKGRTSSKNLSDNLDTLCGILNVRKIPYDVLRAALLLACKDGSDQTVTILLSHGVSPNARDNNGTPCLTFASWYNSESVVHRLIEAGADVILTDRSGRTAWDHIHDLSKHESIASVLWQKGLECYNQMILEAAAAGDADEIQSAIEHGANPSYADANGWTPLHHAAACGNFEAARVLIKAGARINETTRSGETPLDMTHGSIPILNSPGRWLSNIIILLIENGAKETRQVWSFARDYSCVHDEQDNRKETNCAGQSVIDKQDNREVADVSPSPMSWRYTALGAPEVLKESPYKLSRILGLGTHSTAISIDGSSYRPSAPGQASHSLRAILAKNRQGPHKSWSTPPMRTPPL